MENGRKWVKSLGAGCRAAFVSVRIYLSMYIYVYACRCRLVPSVSRPWSVRGRSCSCSGGGDPMRRLFPHHVGHAPVGPFCIPISSHACFLCRACACTFICAHACLCTYSCLHVFAVSRIVRVSVAVMAQQRMSGLVSALSRILHGRPGFGHVRVSVAVVAAARPICSALSRHIAWRRAKI